MSQIELTHVNLSRGNRDCRRGNRFRHFWTKSNLGGFIPRRRWMSTQGLISHLSIRAHSMVDNNHWIIGWIGFPSKYTAGHVFHLTSRAPPHTPLTIRCRGHYDSMDPPSLSPPCILFQFEERWKLGRHWGHFRTNPDRGGHSVFMEWCSFEMRWSTQRQSLPGRVELYTYPPCSHVKKKPILHNMYPRPKKQH